MPCTVLHIPHASTVIPKAQRQALLLSDDELDEEVRRMTDHFTDEIFADLVGEDRSVLFPVSRLVLDPERFVDDAKEPMAARGMGVIYTHGSSGQKLRDPPSPEERKRLLDTYYRPHHWALTSAVAGVLAQSDSCLVLDCHSFPSSPLPYEPDPSAHRPDICIGTDGIHTPLWLRERAVASFTAAGFRVALDRPFAGALVPAANYKKDTRVMALMVEVNRGLYMDEASGLRLSSFSEITNEIQSLVRELVGEGHAA